LGADLPMLILDPVTGLSRSVDENHFIGHEPLLTLRQAARILNIHPRTCREYIRRGLLQGRLINRRWRVRKQAIEKLFAESPSCVGGAR
jgi:excisionase family DNA binding protein